MAGREAPCGCVFVEAEVSQAAGRDIVVGSVLPVHFVMESGSSFRETTGIVVARSAAPEGAAVTPIRLEIALSLQDFAPSMGVGACETVQTARRHPPIKARSRPQ